MYKKALKIYIYVYTVDEASHVAAAVQIWTFYLGALALWVGKVMREEHFCINLYLSTDGVFELDSH